MPNEKERITLMKRALRFAEWGGTSQAQYFGHSKSCPVCRGIRPEDEKDGWIKSAVGHKEDCLLKRALDA